MTKTKKYHSASKTNKATKCESGCTQLHAIEESLPQMNRKVGEQHLIKSKVQFKKTRPFKNLDSYLEITAQNGPGILCFEYINDRQVFCGFLQKIALNK